MMVNAADLRVTVTNGPPGPATLYIALFDTADSFSASRAMMSQKVEMHDGVAQWVFSGLPEGLYAIKSFADENGNGPAGHDLGGERYHHWFDGDGMVHRLVIAGTEVHHQGRYVATAKRVAEVKAGRRLTEGLGTVFKDAHAVTSPDSMNVANISVLPLGDDLLALWEGGSATRLDPRTLETRGLKTWRPDLAGMPFSAHPRVEPDGTIRNSGVSSHSGMLLLFEIAPDGELRRADAIPVSDLPMVHDVAVTAGHLVFLLPPLVYDAQRRAAGASVLDSHVWRPEKGCVRWSSTNRTGRGGN